MEIAHLQDRLLWPLHMGPGDRIERIVKTQQYRLVLYHDAHIVTECRLPFRLVAVWTPRRLECGVDFGVSELVIVAAASGMNVLRLEARIDGAPIPRKQAWNSPRRNSPDQAGPGGRGSISTSIPTRFQKV